MKYRNTAARRVLALVLVLATAFCLTGCGLRDLPVAMSALKLLKLRSVRLAPVVTLEATVSEASGSSADEQTVRDLALTLQGDADLDLSALRFRADVSAVFPFGTLGPLHLRGGDSDGAYTLWYSLDGENWGRTRLSDTDQVSGAVGKAGSFDKSALLGLGSAGFSGFTSAGTESVNGSPAKRYDATLDWASALQASGQQEAFFTWLLQALRPLLGETELTPQQAASMFDLSAQQPLALSLWIDDAAGIPVRLRLDLTEAAAAVLDTDLFRALLSPDAEDASAREIAVDTLSLDLTLSDFDSVGEITLPEIS